MGGARTTAEPALDAPPAERVKHPTYGSFDLIRIVAAALVLFQHSFPATDHAEPSLGRFGSYPMDFGKLAVAVFFLISGFLIVGSWDRDARPLAFVVRRVARIWPAFVVVIVLSAVVLGPIVSDLDAGFYFRTSEARQYIYRNIAFFPLSRWTLPGVFEDNPVTSVNGVLWSLPYEVAAYGAVLVLGLVSASRRIVYIGLLVVALVVVRLQSAGTIALTARLGPLDTEWIVWLGAWFLAGAVLYSWRDHLRDRRVMIAAAAVSLVGALLGEAVLFIPATSALVLALGMTSPAIATRVRRSGDPSYGLYLYAFPVQQTLVWAGVDNPWVLVATALPIALGLAYASWHLVERPVARWAKRRLI